MVVLDPEIKPILEFAGKNIPPMREVSLAKAREMELQFSKMSPVPPVQVRTVEDQVVDGRDAQIKVRIYTPTTVPIGSVVYYHGGGFVLGSIETHDAICRRLVNASECRVISVDYRLAPEHKFPAAVHDAYDAFEWTVERFGGKVCVSGDSAGGNLAAVVAQLASKNGKDALKLQALVYPVLNQAGIERSVIEFSEDYLLTADDMTWFGEQYHTSASDSVDPLASPIHAADLAGLPPAIIITAECDPLRDQGEAYTSLLRKAGVPVIGLRYTGTIHGFMSFPNKMGINAIETVGAFIKSELSSD